MSQAKLLWMMLIMLLPAMILGEPKLIGRSSLPQERVQMNDKDEWRDFWDDYGLGLNNHSGGMFTSTPMTCEKGILTVPFKKGDWGGYGWKVGGAIIYASEPQFESKEVYFEFTVKFGANFDWGYEGEKTRGGKFGPAITVNDVGVGTQPPDWGFEYITMWRDGGRMDAYLYHMDQPGNWPEKQYFGYMETEKWYKFGVHIRANDPGQKNAFVRVYRDGEKLYERSDLRFSQTGTALWKPSFGTFFGGDSDQWQSRTDSDVQYKDFYICDGMMDPSTVPVATAAPRNLVKNFSVLRNGAFEVKGIPGARIEIFEAQGREIATLKPGSSQTVKWNHHTATGRAAGSRIYLYRVLSYEKTVESGRILIP